MGSSGERHAQGVAPDPDVREDAGMTRGSETTPASRRPRGWVSVYALAFLLLVGAGVAMTASAVGFLTSTRLLWTSTVLSGLAILVAIVSVALPRR
jgi:hypothetical protein